MVERAARKESRRTRLTRTALEDSLLSLMEEMPLNRITVSQLCKHAQVHRSTFYLYYQDIRDLLEQIENAFYDKLQQAILRSDNLLPNQLVLLNAYRVVNENRRLSAVLWGPYGDKDFLRRVGEMHREALIAHWQQAHDQLSPKILDYLHAFTAYINMGLMERWTLNNFKETPEELAEITSRLLLYGFSGFIDKLD